MLFCVKVLFQICLKNFFLSLLHFFLSIISHSSHPRRVESSRSCSRQSAPRTKSCKRLRQTVCETYAPWRCEPKSLHFNKVNQKHHSDTQPHTDVQLFQHKFKGSRPPPLHIVQIYFDSNKILRIVTTFANVTLRQASK